MTDMTLHEGDNVKLRNADNPIVNIHRDDNYWCGYDTKRSRAVYFTQGDVLEVVPSNAPPRPAVLEAAQELREVARTLNELRVGLENATLAMREFVSLLERRLEKQ